MKNETSLTMILVCTAFLTQAAERRGTTITPLNASFSKECYTPSVIPPSPFIRPGTLPHHLGTSPLMHPISPDALSKAIPQADQSINLADGQNSPEKTYLAVALRAIEKKAPQLSKNPTNRTYRPTSMPRFSDSDDEVEANTYCAPAKRQRTPKYPENRASHEKFWSEHQDPAFWKEYLESLEQQQ